MEHLSDHDLERYHLGMVKDEAELAPLEEHLLACAGCAERAEEAADYVDTVRQAIILGDFDQLELLRRLDRVRAARRIGETALRRIRHGQRVDIRALLQRLRAEARTPSHDSRRIYPALQSQSALPGGTIMNLLAVVKDEAEPGVPEISNNLPKSSAHFISHSAGFAAGDASSPCWRRGFFVVIGRDLGRPTKAG